VNEKELPLLLPNVADYKPTESGESPLAKAEDWVNIADKKSGKKGKRETNTMPQWAGSCWYYLRFIDPHDAAAGWDAKLEKSWMPVDLYVGGAEHAVLHLLYARFWHKVLFDLGQVSTREPFQKLYNQGMIQAHAYKNRRGAIIPVDQVNEDENGKAVDSKSGEEVERIVAKMSKSLKNVINPDEVIERYGADTLRTYLMFMGPLDAARPWDSKAIIGNYRFLRKAYLLVTDTLDPNITSQGSPDGEHPGVSRAINFAIKSVTKDIEGLSFNTCISTLMEFVNAVSDKRVSNKTLEKFALILSPFAPHLAEELWERLGHKKSLAYEQWPAWDESALERDSVVVVIQVLGKKRGMIDVAPGIAEDALKRAVVEAMAATAHKVSEKDRFITVFQPGTKIPKLVNVIPQQ
jgi:leucyl-tRNA synthetase